MLLGRYELQKEIGRGGSAKVYLAWDRLEKKYWAIKEICVPENQAGKDTQKLAGEVQFLQKLYHPALPRIVQVIWQRDKLYVIMDYVEGCSLEQVFRKEGQISEQKVIALGIQLCKVLIYLHSQNPPIIYRDIKPANIILQENGQLKLIDFGIARIYKKHQKGDTVKLGTPGYCAPEQYSSRGQSDARTDIYSLGVTMYVLLTGHRPWEAPYEICPIRHWNPHFSKELEKIIQKCTCRNPKKRFQNCGEVLKALESCQNR